MSKTCQNSCRIRPWRATGCYRYVCVKSCHSRALKHMEGVRESTAEEEEEERKSLVSSTHLSSSEYSARIGKAIQSSGCSLPPRSYKEGASALLPWQRTVTSQPVATVLGHSHRDVDANIQRRMLRYMLTHTCLRLLVNKNTTESKVEREKRVQENAGKKSRTLHTYTANTLLAVLLAAAYTNNYTIAPVLPHYGLQDKLLNHFI